MNVSKSSMHERSSGSRACVFVSTLFNLENNSTLLVFAINIFYYNIYQGHRSRSASRKLGTDVGLQLSHQNLIRAKYSSPGSTSDDTDAGPSHMMDDHVPHVAIEEEDDMQEGHLVGHSGEGKAVGQKYKQMH